VTRLYQFLFAYEEHKIAIANTSRAASYKSQQPNYTLIIPFLSYSTFNNTVTLKSGLEVTQGH